MRLPLHPPARRLACALALALATGAGCASAPRAPATEAPIFYPPPPDLPRLQFLTSFNGLKDVEEQSRFNRFVVGEAPDARLDKPYGVAIHDGKIYVCDTNATVVVFDLPGRNFGVLAGALSGAGKLSQPVNISIDSRGRKYVADPGRSQIVVYDRDDTYLRSYGHDGAWRPVDAVPFEDRLYVADFANGVVRVFEIESGKEIRTIGDRGEPDGRLARPTNLAFSRNGRLFVTDFVRFQVLEFDRDGHFRQAFGRPGDNMGHFARPKGIDVDREGRLFAVDASFANVQIFGPDGRFLMYFGQGGEEKGDFLLPAKVTIDYDNVDLFRPYAAPGFELEAIVLVTSQFGPRLVNVLGFGHERGRRYPTDEELLEQMQRRWESEVKKQGGN